MTTLFNEKQIRETARQRNWRGIRGVGVGLLLLILSAGLTAANQNQLAVIPFALFILLMVPFAIYIEQIKIVCPACDRNVARRHQWLLDTRCCSECEERIVAGGVVRSTAVYRRYLRIRGRAFLRIWFWAWPALATGCYLAWLIRPAAIDNLMLMAVLSLAGVMMIGWTILRTFDRRYLPSFFASLILLGLGAVNIWNGG